MAPPKDLREPNLHVRILTTPTVDTRGACAIIEFSGNRYIIGNAHEGLARVLTQNLTFMNKISDVLLTGKSDWKHQGGMVGLMLTLADAKGNQWKDVMQNVKKATPEKPTLRVCGGSNTKYTLATARKFIMRQACHTKVDEMEDNISDSDISAPTWHDDNVRAWAMPIQPTQHAAEPVPSLLDRPAHSRKRSLDDYLGSKARPEEEPAVTASQASDAAPKEKSPSTNLESVLSSMFNSNWRQDALEEKALADADPSTDIFIKNPKTKDFELLVGAARNEGDLPKRVWQRRPWPGALVADLPKTAQSSTAMSYIVKDYPRRGKIDKAKLQEFDLKGVVVGRISLGESVVNPAGRTVHPHEVMGGSLTAAGFAFIDLPSADYVPALIGRREWRKPEIMDGISFIIWNLGPGVSKDPQLQSFITGSGSIQHVIISPDHCPNTIVYDSAATTTVTHSMIDSKRYKDPVHNNKVAPFPEKLSQCAIAKPGLRLYFRKEPIVDQSGVHSPLRFERIKKNMRSSIIQAGKAVDDDIADPSFQKVYESQNLPSPDAEIVTLGTGASAPTKFRNVSGTLVRVPGAGSYLLDCGENTLGQLGRTYTASELVDVLRELKMIFISHMHADHHLGTVSVIQAWHRAVYGEPGTPKAADVSGVSTENFNPTHEMAQGPRLTIVSEPTMVQWLHEYSRAEDLGRSKLVFLAANAEHKGRNRLRWNDVPVEFVPSGQNAAVLQHVTGLAKFEVGRVSHCAGAHGVALTWPDGFKVSYSGDCRPSKQLVDIGRNSTVLVHEATFEESKIGHAIAKKHSTVDEAIGVALAMGARRLVLTHFSSRYIQPLRVDLKKYRPLTFEGSPLTLDPEPIAQDSKPSVQDPERATLLESGTKKLTDKAGELFFTQSYSTLDAAAAQAAAGAEVAETAAPEKAPEKALEKARAKESFKTDLKLVMGSDYMRVKVKDIILMEKYIPAWDALHKYRPNDFLRTPTPSPERRSPKRSPRLRPSHSSERGRARSPEHDVIPTLLKEEEKNGIPTLLKEEEKSVASAFS